jgi:type II secretory pathway component PulK
MRVPPFERFVRGMQLFGVLLLGMVLGAVVLNSLFVAKFQAQYETQSELEDKLEQYEQDLIRLAQYKNQHTVIKSIQLRLEDNANQRGKMDKVTEAELIRRVKDDLSIFIGRNIYDIDSDAKLTRQLLGEKVYTDVNGKDFTVELRTVLLSEYKLQIWMSTKPFAKPPTS